MTTDTAIALCIVAIAMMLIVIVSNAGYDTVKRRRRKR